MGDAYPRTVYDGEDWSGHRLSYHLNVSPIPRKTQSMKEGLVLHTCDHKWCVNPKHLYLGTARQNVIDAYERGGDRRLRLSQNTKGRPKSEETRRRMSLSQIGNKKGAFKRSDQAKKNMSEAAKRRWAKIKEQGIA